MSPEPPLIDDILSRLDASLQALSCSSVTQGVPVGRRQGSSALEALPTSLWPDMMTHFFEVNAHVEFRKKVTFFFAELVYRESAVDSSDFSADETVEPSEGELLRYFMRPSSSGNNVNAGHELLARLASSVVSTSSSYNASSGSLFRVLIKHPCVVLHCALPLNTPTASCSSQRFGSTILGTLFCSSPEAILSQDAFRAGELWTTIEALLTQQPSHTAAFLKDHFDEFIWAVTRLLTSASGALDTDSGSFTTNHNNNNNNGAGSQYLNFYALWHLLRILTQLLGDPSYLKLRLLLAESPALMIALLKVAGVMFHAHHIRYEVYHCLKVFVAKVNKPAPIRYLCWINRDHLVRFFEECLVLQERQESSCGEGGVTVGGSGEAESLLRGQREETKTLVQRLRMLAPLSHEELLLTGALVAT